MSTEIAVDLTSSEQTNSALEEGGCFIVEHRQYSSTGLASAAHVIIAALPPALAVAQARCVQLDDLLIWRANL